MAFLARVGIIALLLIGYIPPAAAEENLKLYEQDIKAGLIYNFLKYTIWPGNGSSMTVCLFGDDPFRKYLKPMEERTVNQRPIVIRQINTVQETDGCHLLFVNAGEKTRWTRLRANLAEKNILTVSDYPGFANAGGMIEFGHNGKRINATLNMEAVTAAGLRVEDRLLKLVTVIHSKQARRP